ncbi:hypothetical protein QYE76_009145 [Lolium multiflorum]|uniref:FBD domain-containing protein n=1 Tax=Lolium multiflorum TaxID=4521 RepID=A0AAD8X0M6_LOLMU|nr:hypothetical protein QYE76_009145 [Lolium multiflorum]
MAAGEDHISRLTDDLLRLILRLVPAKEGAFTTMLSRRWRPLWTSSGAVNIVARILENDEQHVMESTAFYARRDRFVAGTFKALDAFHKVVFLDPVKILTLRVEGQAGNIIRDYLNRDADWRGRPQVLAKLLSHPAARDLEEIRIAAVDNIDGEPMLFEQINHEADPNSFRVRLYTLSIGSLPSHTIRVLDLTNCGELAPASSELLLPLLVSLRLRHCNVPLEVLQGLIGSAPQLSSIYLEYVLLEEQQSFQEDDPPQDAVLRLLSCPSARVLVIDRCCIMEEGTFRIYAPLLWRFEYTGVIRNLLLSPPPLDLVQAKVTLVDYRRKVERDKVAARRNFWSIVRGLCHARQLTLHMFYIEEFAVSTKANQATLLPVLPKLEQLKLDGVFWPTRTKAAKTIGNLLRCCPGLLHLRLNLKTHEQMQTRSESYALEFLKRKAEKDRKESLSCLERPERQEEDFKESPSCFKRRRTQTATDNEDGFYFDDMVPDMAGLSDHTFECLETTLKTVSLQFQEGEKNLFGVKLVKYFIKHGKVLEKIFVDPGNEKYRDRMSIKIEKWVTCLSTRRIQVLPLLRE